MVSSRSGQVKTVGGTGAFESPLVSMVLLIRFCTLVAMTPFRRFFIEQSAGLDEGNSM